MSRLPSILLRRKGFTPLDSWFGNIDDAMSSMLQNWSPAFSNEGGTTFPIDLKETEKEYEIKADLPGVNKEDVHLTLEDKMLTIELKQDRTEEHKENNYLVRERFSKLAARTISLPFTSSESKVTAALRDGVLTISVPKAAEKQTRRISVS